MNNNKQQELFNKDEILIKLRKEIIELQQKIQKKNLERSKLTMQLVELKGKIQKRKIEIIENNEKNNI